MVNGSTGSLDTVAIKLDAVVYPKSIDLGKFEVGSKMDTGEEFTVSRMSFMVDGAPHILIDKLNYKCVINGVDFLSDTKKAIGLA